MTEWMLMRKDGIDEPAQVTRESFRLCHEPHGWVEYTPPTPQLLEASEADEVVEDPDVQPPADDTSEPETGSTTSTRRRSAAPKE